MQKGMKGKHMWAGSCLPAPSKAVSIQTIHTAVQHVAHKWHDGHAGERCVQARCVVPQAMPVPLPYPSIFQPTVLRYGDLAPQEPHPNANGAGTHTTVLLCSIVGACR